jgi:hypothetical protein
MATNTLENHLYAVKSKREVSRARLVKITFCSVKTKG